MFLPGGLFLLLYCLPLFLIFAVGNVIRARREKEKVYYLNALGSVLMALISVFTYLKEFLLVLFLFSINGLLIIGTWSKQVRLMQQRYAKIWGKVDLSAPLRLREVFTTKFWLAIASRWGVGRAALLSALLSSAIIGGLLLPSSLLGFTSTFSVVTSIIIVFTVSIIFYYWLFNRSLASLKEI